MILTVSLMPAAARAVDRSVCIVLDVLRASSTISAMFEAGAAELVLADSTDDALTMARHARSAHLVCGERDGLPPAGFDLGNSPVQIADTDLTSRRVVYVTSNGTRALRAVAAAPIVLVGGPRNALAVVHRAMREAAERAIDVLIVCAGDDGGRSISLEDAFCAGLYIEWFIRHGSRLVAPEETAGRLDVLALDDSATLVHRLYRSYLPPAHDGPVGPDTIKRVFAESRNGRDLPRKGLADDLDYCAAVDVSTVVPRLLPRDDRLALVSAP